MLWLQVSSLDGSSQLGMITKQWSGFAREFFTDAENFGIQCKISPLILPSVVFAEACWPRG